MLIPNCEFFKQYSIYFSLPAALTPFFSIATALQSYQWYELEFLTSWLDHFFAVAVPLFMWSGGRIKPRKNYIFPVLAGVFVYFSLSAFAQYFLIKYNIIKAENSLSWVFSPKGMPILKELYSLIPIPFVYMLPLLPIVLLYFYVFYLIFGRKKLRIK